MTDLAPRLPIPDQSGQPSGVLNARCYFFDDDGERVVFVAGLPVHRYAPGDIEAEDWFIAQALLNGYAKAGELSRALERPLRSVHRARERYVQEGGAGLVRKKRGPKGPRLGARQEALIRSEHAKGTSAGRIAKRLGVVRTTVTNAMRRMGLEVAPPKGRAQQQPSLELVEVAAEPGQSSAPSAVEAPKQGEAEAQPASPAPAEAEVAVEATMAGDLELPKPAPEPVPVAEPSLDTKPDDRSIDRMLARQGKLDDAAPMFAAASAVPRAGVLLAVPLLVCCGVLQEARSAYGNIGSAFYGLRTSLVALLFLALLRIKRPENLKEHSPPELGRLLGLDRAPEVKTLRRKLRRLSDDGPTLERFLAGLFKRRVDQRSEAMGFLYVDGHVRVYSGKADLPKTHVARIRLSLPAAQDMWVNDADGQPVFFVQQDAHPQLVSALPPILTEVRRLVGPDRRVTVVFDRGGWSPDLFAKMYADGFDVLTYRKGRTKPVAVDQFTTHEVQTPLGKLYYELAEAEVTVGLAKLSMRQVTRRQGDHQTHIVTTRRDLSVVEVARRMFDRWRQENFFKYMREQFAIDALVEHGTEPGDAERSVPNPEWKAADKPYRQAKQEVTRLEAQYGAAALDNPEARRPTMRGFKIAHGTELGIPLRQAREQADDLKAKRDALPQRVAVGSIRDNVVRLPAQRKRLSDALKMVAYQVESDLVRAVSPHYRRSLHEARPLVRAALQSAGDIEPTDDELRITLAPQSSPHRTRAIAELCRQLTDMAICFPGTKLRMVFATHGVRDDDCAN